MLEDATVKAPSEGTIIDKTVSVGTVIASASGSVSGGSTIVKMADLTVVRIRALFNETDIGNVHPGQAANVTVDAYPDRRFTGVVEKIEPQAVVQQNVTMFPVLVNLENREALLKPGMNGSIAVLIDEHDDVLAIPNDAIKNPREAVATGAMLGIVADTINAELKAQGYTAPGTRGGFGGGNRNGGAGAGGGGRRGGAGGGAAAVVQRVQAAPRTVTSRSWMSRSRATRRPVRAVAAAGCRRCPTPTARKSTTFSRRTRKRRSSSTIFARR